MKDQNKNTIKSSKINSEESDPSAKLSNNEQNSSTINAESNLALKKEMESLKYETLLARDISDIKLNNIRLFWISVPANRYFDGYDLKFFNRSKLSDMDEYARFKIDVSMWQLSLDSGLNAIILPNGHYSEAIHDLTADRIYDRIKEFLC